MLNFTAEQSVASNTLLNTVYEHSNIRVQDCYQCGKCSAGCPIVPFMDLMPRQVMRAVQLGQTDLALRSSAIWLCASCQTCSARCPMEIDIARVMDSLRHISRAEGVKPAEKDILLSYNLFLELVKRLGRIHETGLVAGLNLGMLKPFANVFDIGLPMFIRGKLRLLSTRAGVTDLKRIFAATQPLNLEQSKLLVRSGQPEANMCCDRETGDRSR